MAPEISFRERYGEWAIICGASEGVGECFARTLAQQGLNLVLVSRRQEVLDRLAADITAETGVAVKTLATDLALEAAVEAIKTLTADLEVGMLVYCAGADPEIKPFRQRPLDGMTSLVKRNCLTSLALCHHFGPRMADRGRGALLLLSSGAGLQGIKYLVAYSASKAFDIAMGEALWAELREFGVDVLSLVLTTTDTPAYRRTLVGQGVLDSVEHKPEIPGLVPPQLVVDEALANLQNGPCWFVSERFRETEKRIRSMTRNEAVQAVAAQIPSRD